MSQYGKRLILGLMMALAMLVIASGIGLTSRSVSVQAAAPQASNIGNIGSSGVSEVMVSHSIKHDVSPSLLEIAAKLPKTTTKGEIGDDVEIPDWAQRPFVKDPVLQNNFGNSPFAMPTPIQNFDGVSNLDGVYPPDTEGDVGPNDYVQWVNLHYQIYSKTGTPRLLSPLPGSAFWTGFGGLCETTNHGDPLVTYDGMANRWVVSQFAFSGTGTTPPYHQCIAVSTTGDPTGTYNRYDFIVSNVDFNDYGKQGVWPDAYYHSYVRFTGGGTYAGQQATAFDRAAMIAGNPTATMVSFNIGTIVRVLLPSDLDGQTLPPAGAPNVYAGLDSNVDAMDFWNFHVDFVTPANSTFTGPTSVPIAAFNRLCPATRSCIPQPGTAVGIDALGNRLMYRAAYRNMGSYQVLMLNHSADVGAGQAGVRWYEFRSPASSPTIFQSGTYAPDAVSRWMASIAMDHVGNIAVGYSVSSSTVFPGIRYAGRLAGDPIGTLGQGEATLIDGAGSQTGTGSRWGDYSAMQVDPSDDCTFWYTTEYYQTTSAVGWKTRIGSFKFPDCSQGTPTPTATGTPPTATRTPTVTITPTRTNTATAVPTPCSASDFVSTDVPKTICDNCTVTSNLVVPAGTGNIGTIELRNLDITHTYIGDLIVTLTSPNNTSVVLINHLCTSSANYPGINLSDSASGPITCPPAAGATYRPSNPLAGFAGQNPVGTWILTVSDTATLDVGTLNAWGIRIGIACPSPTPGGATNTPVPPTATNTPVPPTATNTRAATQTPCPINFTDVHTTDYFYVPVQYLFCRNVISGYDTEFRPYNNTSRGQLCKIVVLGLNITINTAGGPHFIDVLPTNVFYPYVETLFNRGSISGYGTEFRPNDNVSRGQLSKIVVLAAGWERRNPATATFTDVPVGSTFFSYVETAVCHGIVSGYGTLFKPNDPATRGQIAKIVYLAITNTTICP